MCCVWIYTEPSSPMSTKLLGKKPAAIGGHIWKFTMSIRAARENARHTFATSFPLIRPIDTGPYVLESLDNSALSPMNQTWPLGITTCSVDGARRPVGSTQMTSPGRPTSRLQTTRVGSIGEMYVRRSPRLRFFGDTMRLSNTTSPVAFMVGSMDGPETCAFLSMKFDDEDK